jgi:hypothetical protein
MDTIRKFLIGGLCLLLCTVVYARLSSVYPDLRQANVDSLARLCMSAAPYALITPVKPHVRTAVIRFAHDITGVDAEPAPVAATDDRLAPYVYLHNTRIERLP